MYGIPLEEYWSSVQRGLVLAATLRDMPLVGVPEATVPVMCGVICHCLSMLYAAQSTPTVARLQAFLHESHVHEAVVEAALPICARNSHLFKLWVPADYQVCVLLLSEPEEKANLQRVTFDGPYSQELVAAFHEVMVARLLRHLSAGASI